MKYLKQLSIFIAVLISFELLLFNAPVSAKPIFKNGDIVKIIVPFSPGGGYDRACRLIAPFLEEELEKMTGTNLTVIIVNVTGAGGVKGYSRMYRAKPDGKTIGMLGLAAAPYQQLATGMFDLNKFTFVAIVNTDPNVLVISKNMPVNSFKDLLKRSQEKPILMSTSGRGASEHVEPLLVQALLKKHGKEFPLDFIHYRGSAPAALSIIKGEAEALMATESASYSHVKNGDLKPIIIFNKNRGKLQSDVRTVFEQNVPGAEELSSVVGMIRTIVAPPGLPKDTAQILRDAMLNSLQNPKLVQKAKTMEIPLGPATGEMATQAAVKRLNNAKNYRELILSTFK